jgi:hypothetical protein
MAQKSAQANSGTFAIKGTVSDEIKEVFDITGFSNMLTFVE